jgi:hypothetical protein
MLAVRPPVVLDERVGGGVVRIGDDWEQFGVAVEHAVRPEVVAGDVQ